MNDGVEDAGLDGGIARRRLLQLTGTGIAGVAAFGTATADVFGSWHVGGLSPDLEDQLDDGVVTHAKYQVSDDESYDLIPEPDKTRGDTLDVLDREHVIEFSDIVRNSEDEIMALSWDAAPYYVDQIHVKHGGHYEEFDGGFSGSVSVKGNAISHIVFGKKVFFQVDIITGTDFEDTPKLADDQEDVLCYALLGNSTDGISEERAFREPLSGGELTEHDVDLDFTNKIATTSVDVGPGTTFEISDGEGLFPDRDEVEVSLLVYERPGPAGEKDVTLQQLVDTDTAVLSWSDTAGDSATLSATLPQM